MIHIAIPNNYQYGYLYGSWDNWTEPINLETPEFKINSFNIFIIETSNKSVCFKLKINNEYKLIDTLLTSNVGGYTNNYCYLDDEGYSVNGVTKIKYSHYKIIVIGTTQKLNIVLFEGNAKLGLPHGNCKEYYDNGIIKYDGNYKYGNKYGTGVEYYSSGVPKYEGEFDDKWNGNGVEFYENAFKQIAIPNDLMINTESIVSQEKYVGTLKDYLYHGYGIIYYENGNKMYEGYLSNHLYHGSGILYYKEGNIQYDGNWICGSRNGFGTEYYKNNNKKYEGEWLDNNKNGNGIFYYDNGNKRYEGSILNNKGNGPGIMFYESGKPHFEGVWIDNKLNGNGTEYYENGKVKFKGEWISGNKKIVIRKSIIDIDSDSDDTLNLFFN